MSISARALKWSALIVPLWFVFVVVLAAHAHPTYGHNTHAVSELTAADSPLALLVRFGGFTILGSAVFLFGWVAPHKLAYPQLKRALRWSYMTIGVLIFFAGVFESPARDQPNATLSFMHLLFAVPLLFCIAVIPFTCGLRLWSTPHQRPFSIVSMGVGILILLFFVFMPNGVSQGWIEFQKMLAGNFFYTLHDHYGLFQRMMLTTFFGWTMLLTWRKGMFVDSR